jgi:hypothetical protein
MPLNHPHFGNETVRIVVVMSRRRRAMQERFKYSEISTNKCALHVVV